MEEKKKSQYEFQKDILDILKQNTEKNEEFRKEINEKIEELKKDKAISTNGDNINFSFSTHIVSTTKIPISHEETIKKAKELGEIIGPLMEQYKISKLECDVIRVYE